MYASVLWTEVSHGVPSHRAQSALQIVTGSPVHSIPLRPLGGPTFQPGTLAPKNAPVLPVERRGWRNTMWELLLTVGLGFALAAGYVGAWLFAGWAHSRHHRPPWH